MTMLNRFAALSKTPHFLYDLWPDADGAKASSIARRHASATILTWKNEDTVCEVTQDIGLLHQFTQLKKRLWLDAETSAPDAIAIARRGRLCIGGAELFFEQGIPVTRGFAALADFDTPALRAQLHEVLMLQTRKELMEEAEEESVF